MASCASGSRSLQVEYCMYFKTVFKGNVTSQIHSLIKNLNGDNPQNILFGKTLMCSIVLATGNVLEEHTM